ncbi:serine--tRNA ligase [bacterium]|nr:serine--tRNA ligase [bacterium]
MLTIAQIKEHTEALATRLDKRNRDFRPELQAFLSEDGKRRAVQKELDDVLAEANRLAREIGDLFKSGHREQAEPLKARTAELKEREKALSAVLSQQEQILHELLSQIPNAPHEGVAAGKSAEDNVETDRQGDLPALYPGAVPHWDLAKQYGLIDFELGVKVTGAGFPVYRSAGARLQRGLIAYFLDRNTRAGYEEVIPPHFVNEDSAFGTGQLPDKEGQMYTVPLDGLYAIPTAEVPVTNLYRGEIVPAEQLPIRLTAYSPCFRREAGSYGKDVRGLNRLHQFDKVEIVVIEHPSRSYATLEGMVEHVAGLLKELELPYRILRLCGGDMGFTSAMTYDFEVWSAAQERWLEVSSVSNFETFQANRLKLRYREGDAKPELCHTLNGSALALPRIVAALLENHQTPDGIRIPEALVPFVGMNRIER